jgi:hypothetical protein
MSDKSNKPIRWPISIKFIKMPNGTLIVKGDETPETLNQMVREK